MEYNFNNSFTQEAKSGNFLSTFLSKFISIFVVDLKTEEAIVLKSIFFSTSTPMMWGSILEHYLDNGIYEDDIKTVADTFSIEALRELVDSGSSETSVKIRERFDENNFGWVESTASLIIEEGEQKVIIASRNINKQKIWESIVEQFVFNNCDYFVIVDIYNNSVDRFMAIEDGTDVPPEHSDDYLNLMIEYNKQYAMPYDVERLTDAMRIENMTKLLDSQDVYSIYIDSNSLTEDGIPRRKWLQFAYHDKPRGLIMVARSDITGIYLQEKKRNEQLNAALIRAQTDSMTGLYNHVATLDYIRRALDEGCKDAVVMYVDVDNFKIVNDTQGHQAGDHLLTFMGQTLTKIVGQKGVVGRIGGDEFLVFIESEVKREEIESMAVTICNTFATGEYNILDSSQISCSVGIALYPSDGQDSDMLIRSADRALYQSKHKGKKRFVFYSEI